MGLFNNLKERRLRRKQQQEREREERKAAEKSAALIGMMQNSLALYESPVAGVGGEGILRLAEDTFISSFYELKEMSAGGLSPDLEGMLRIEHFRALRLSRIEHRRRGGLEPFGKYDEEWKDRGLADDEVHKLHNVSEEEVAELVKERYGKIDREEEKRRVVVELRALMEGRQSAFISAPPIVMRTKTLDEECVEAALHFLNVEREGRVEMFFGSFTTMMQVKPELRRIPGDIDVQLSVGEEEAKLIVGELYVKLQERDKTLRINPEKPTIIETNKNGKWERALDIHYAGEPPEDSLSPMAALGGAFQSFEKDRTYEQHLIDALDIYIISRTLLESARLQGEGEATTEQWEKLLKRYVELHEDEIDFDRLELRLQ